VLAELGVFGQGQQTGRAENVGQVAMDDRISDGPSSAKPATLRRLLRDDLIDTDWRVTQAGSASKRRW